MMSDRVQDLDLSSESQTLSRLAQFSYGAGDLGPSMAGNINAVFYFFFLTNVAGLSPSLVGSILLLSNIWSAISTLLVGVWCDRTHCRWGRRRIWMFGSAPVLAFSFLAIWWVPFDTPGHLFVYYLSMTLLFQTASTTFGIPYGALITDISDHADEQTRLTSCRFSFSLGGCLISLLLAQVISHSVTQPRQQFVDLGIICTLSVIVSIGCCCFCTQERPNPVGVSQSNLWQELKPILGNRPLWLLIGIYSLSWMAVQLLPAILPYFVTTCMHLNATAITQITLVMQGTALVGLLLWEPLSRQVGKKTVFAVGTSLWILAEVGLIQLNPSQVNFMYGLAMLAGLGMATSYFIPLSMLPEVADWDELQTGQRREGLFYSLMMFLFKVFFALSIFFVGQLLSWSGYQEGLATNLAQPESALTAIRLVVGVLPVVALTISLVLMYFYPISKSVHEETIGQLQQRRILICGSSSK